MKQRNKFGAGKVTQSDIGRAVGVHQNTVARWERGNMLPEDTLTLSRLAQIANHVDDWHLRIGQFMVVESEPQSGDGCFNSIGYTPTKSKDTIKVSCKLASRLTKLKLMATGSDKSFVQLSSDQDNKFGESITFEDSGRKILSRGKTIEFYVRFFQLD